MGGEAYAEWVRRAIGHARTAGADIVPLFDSSVEEPVELLRSVVARGFSDRITSKYQSVFVSGNPYVLEALSDRYEVPTDRILTTTGATTALSLIYRAFLQPGDHVLIESPGFDLFEGIGTSVGARIDRFRRAGDDFGIDESDITARLTPRTKLIVLSDLHNPSGALLNPEAVRRVADGAAERGVRVIVDEVYGDYADSSARPKSAAHLSSNIIAVNSLTKIFGLSSLRCGWIIASPENIAPIRQVSDRYEFGVSKLAHAVAALVLEEYRSFQDYSASVLATARPIIARHVDEWRRANLIAGRLPEFGCIFFPRVVGVGDTVEFSEWLADRYGVIVAPGEFFGAPGHVRIGFGHPPELLERGLARFYKGLREYKAVFDDAKSPTVETQRESVGARLDRQP